MNVKIYIKYKMIVKLSQKPLEQIKPKFSSIMTLKFENTAYNCLPIDKSNINKPR